MGRETGVGGGIGTRPGGGNCCGHGGYGLSCGDGMMRGSAGKYAYHGAVGGGMLGNVLISTLKFTRTRVLRRFGPSPQALAGAIAPSTVTPSMPSHQRREIECNMRVLSGCQAGCWTARQLMRAARS